MKGDKWRKEVGWTLQWHVLPKIGDMPADRVTRAHILAVLKPLDDRLGVHNHAIAAIKRTFNWAEEQQLYEGSNPTDHKAIKKARLDERQRVLSDDELEQLDQKRLHGRLGQRLPHSPTDRLSAW